MLEASSGVRITHVVETGPSRFLFQAAAGASLSSRRQGSVPNAATSRPERSSTELPLRETDTSWKPAHASGGLKTTGSVTSRLRIGAPSRGY